MTMHSQRGVSTFKMLFLLLIIGGVITIGIKIFPVYYTQMKVQSSFENISRQMADSSELTIRSRLPVLLKSQNVNESDLPQAFYDNLEIDAGYGRVDISSHYHVIVWLMGPVQGANPDADYDPVQLTGMDKIRDRARVDLDFEVHAKTP